MTAPLIISPGTRYGRLVVIARAANTAAGKTRWLCRCDCGAEITVVGSALRSQQRSCRSCAAWKGTHGHTRGRRYPATYRAWCKMRARCHDPRDASYPHYGGRGITICPEWLGPGGYAQFLADMGERPGPDLTLDRIDNDGPYSPSNCRWTTRAVQSTNQRGSLSQGTVLAIRSAYEREHPTFAELGRRFGITGQGARNIALRKTWRHI